MYVHRLQRNNQGSLIYRNDDGELLFPRFRASIRGRPKPLEVKPSYDSSNPPVSQSHDSISAKERAVTPPPVSEGREEPFSMTPISLPTLSHF